MVGVLLTLASCIGDTRLLIILAYVKDYSQKLLVIIIIIIIVNLFYGEYMIRPPAYLPYGPHGY